MSTCRDRHFAHAVDPQAELFPEEPLYRVSVYWGYGDQPAVDANGGWKVRTLPIRKWDIRRVLRMLYGEGWDTETILVERM